MKKRLSHVDARGRVRMVDVSAKKVTLREAVAHGRVFMRGETLELLRTERAPKGNVLEQYLALSGADRASFFAANRAAIIAAMRG